MRKLIVLSHNRRPRAMAFVSVLGLLIAAGLLPQSAAATVGPLPRDTTPVTTCVPNGGAGSTCTGPFNAWDPTANGGAGGPLQALPTVTVDQTENLTNQMVHLTWANFTPSVNDSGGVGYTALETEYAVGVFECRTTDPQPGTGIFLGQTTGDCYSLIPGNQPTAGPVNGVMTFTGNKGMGAADIQIETSVENSFLGCSDQSQCSLVVVPNWGGNIGSGDCTDHSLDGPGFGLGYDLDTNIGTQCSWMDRIVVPLSFAPTPTEFCPAADNQFTSEGGAALERAMTQWRPAWCKPAQGQQSTTFDYVSNVDEYRARSDFLGSGQALTASTDVAIVNRPATATDTAGSARKFTYAPLAVSGIAIAYYVDDQSSGQPITDLKLNARLVAKLLTQSYSSVYGACGSGQTDQSALCDPADAGNPVDLFNDPEFHQLNPQYQVSDLEPVGNGGVSRDFMPVVLAGNSDLTYELTRWIESDPDARAFLQGQPDPWNMHVNSYYRGISYPIAQLLPQDPGWTGSATPGAPVTESMQLLWNPVNGLDNVVHRLAGNSSSALTNTNAGCSDPNYPSIDSTCLGNWTYPHDAAQTLGQRGLFAIVDQGSAAAFRFPTAQLVNAAGDAVAPTTVSMTAAVNDMQTNPDKITQYADFTNTDPKAYPLTMAWYAAVPTCGLSSTAAQSISRFLTYAATSAQLYGTDLGELPPFGGYLALSDAQKAQTAAAAQQVSTQSCTSPPPDNTVSGQTTSTVTPPPAHHTSGGGSSPTSAAPTSTSSPPSSTSPKPTPKSTAPATVPLGYKGPDSGGWLDVATPVALGFAGALLVLSVLIFLLNGTSPGQTLRNRVRRWLGRPPAGDDLGDVQ